MEDSIRIKQKVRNRTRYLQRIGAMLKTERCEICNIEPATQNHHVAYDKPEKTIRVCDRCHAIMSWKRRKQVDGNNNKPGI